MRTGAVTATTSPRSRRTRTMRSPCAVTVSRTASRSRAPSLRIVRVRRDRGLVVAVTAPVRMGEVAARERWSISVRAGDVSVEMHPETAVDDASGWERDTRVCDCYHYAREREMLRAIRERVALRGG